MTGQEPVTKFTEHGKVEAGVRQFQPSQILPIDARSHRLGRPPRSIRLCEDCEFANGHDLIWIIRLEIQ